MAKKDVGIYQLSDGSWGYRIKIRIDGKDITRKKTKGEDGKKFTTKAAAIKAREASLNELQSEKTQEDKILRRTVKDVYQEYCKKGRNGKAYETMRKQDSLWNVHLKSEFGNKFVDSISVAEVEDYLADLYYVKGYSFQYTESFLKMFYLIFGQAYSRNHLSINIYNKLCVNKNTKIKMPKLKDNEDTDIVVFSEDELKLLDAFFKDTKVETAYLLGKYCGLRINECFGLKWDNVNLDEGTIIIDRQLQYQNGIMKLVPPKTRNGKRTIILSDKMIEHLKIARGKMQDASIKYANIRMQRRRLIEDIDGKNIPSTEFVNCCDDGTMMTRTLFKYHTRNLKNKYGIVFKYHYLRHTYGTKMAEMNIPPHLLCNQMGHGNVRVTQQYYIATTKTGEEIIKANVNKL